MNLRLQISKTAPSFMTKFNIPMSELSNFTPILDQKNRFFVLLHDWWAMICIDEWLMSDEWWLMTNDSEIIKTFEYKRHTNGERPKTWYRSQSILVIDRKENGLPIKLANDRKFPRFTSTVIHHQRIKHNSDEQVSNPIPRRINPPPPSTKWDRKMLECNPVQKQRKSCSSFYMIPSPRWVNSPCSPDITECWKIFDCRWDILEFKVPCEFA